MYKYKAGWMLPEMAASSNHIDFVKFIKKNDHGVIHSDDGPAVVTRMHKCWFKNGLLHREDGPAVVSKSGNKEYWINGKQYDKECYNSIYDGRLWKIIYG